MNSDQARRIVTLHDQHDRALANLRNAAAMSTDDPRATELLEEAVDAYTETLAALVGGQAAVINGPLRMIEEVGEALTADNPEGVQQPSGIAPGAEDPATGGSQVQPEADRGTPAEARETIPVPRPEVPADAASDSETAAEDSGRGDTPKDA